MTSNEKDEALRSDVRDATAQDIPAVVLVHQLAFRGFFLDRMGSRFLRAYYSTILEYEDSIFLVHVNEAKRVDGFAVGFRHPSAFYDYFRSRRLRLAPIIALSLFRRPALLSDIAHNTRRVASAGKSAAGTVELSSIGTSQLGAGIGSTLLKAFCTRSRLLKADEVILTTDRDANDKVLNFYLAHGFEKQSTERRGERVLQIMSRDLR